MTNIHNSVAAGARHLFICQPHKLTVQIAAAPHPDIHKSINQPCFNLHFNRTCLHLRLHSQLFHSGSRNKMFVSTYRVNHAFYMSL